MTLMTRRELLLTLPALGLAQRIVGQSTPPILPVKALNHFTLAVSDVDRSVAFYQGLFGMPIQARQGSTVLLRMGDGPQFLALSPAGAEPPRIVPHVGMAMENFDVDRILEVLSQHGVTRAAPADPGLAGGPLKVRVSMRGETTELYFGDPDGLVIQLQDETYCGGEGALGAVCAAAPTPGEAPLSVRELGHFTISVSDAGRSNAFYQALFGMPVRSRQANAPGLGVGPGVMFVMFIGGGGRGGAAAARPASINHVCMNMVDFEPDAVLEALADYGISARGEASGPVPPLRSYVTLRMPNRGGAPGGTPELYFTDPDGLLIQLQDVRYCGGGGILGDECLA